MGIPDQFVCHGKREEMLKVYGLTSQGIAEAITQLIPH
jgi:deoxyxylulose-5-phosphate synthase